MKSIAITIIFTLMNVLLSGCDKELKIDKVTIEKSGAPELIAVSDIATHTFLNPVDRDVSNFTIENTTVSSLSQVYNSIDYPSEVSEGSVDDPWRIAFNIKYIDKFLHNINYDLCSVGKKDFLNYSNDYYPYRLLIDESGGHLFLSIERLKERGILASSFEKQEDMCVYLLTTFDSGYTKKTRRESNTLVYTAEEINAAVAEYEQLKAGE